MRRVLAVVFLLALLLGLGLVQTARADSFDGESPELGVCHGWQEYSRTIVVTEEVVELEHQLAKHTRERTKGKRGWSDWSEPVLWEPLSHETWVTEIPEPNWQPHHRSPGLQRDWALLPTGYADTVVVTPEVTETETVWSVEHPGDGWEPTGATDVGLPEDCYDHEARAVTAGVRATCPPDGEIIVDVVNGGEVDEVVEVNGRIVEVAVGDAASISFAPAVSFMIDVVWLVEDQRVTILVHDEVLDCPTVDESFEAEADHTDPPVEVSPAPVAAERLPRTGIKEDLSLVGLVLLFVGGLLLGVEVYDRRKRREA